MARELLVGGALGLVVAACGAPPEPACDAGGSSTDGACEVFANCPTSSHGYSCATDGGAAVCTCGGATTTFTGGCPGTGATHLLALRQKCGFADVFTSKTYCQNVGGTTEECAALAK